MIVTVEFSVIAYLAAGVGFSYWLERHNQKLHGFGWEMDPVSFVIIVVTWPFCATLFGFLAIHERIRRDRE